MLPRVAGPRFCFGRIRRVRCGVESPELLAGLDVVRGHPAIGAHLIGRRPEDDHVSDNERGHVVLVALLVVDQDLVPDHAARLHVDREQVTVDGGPEEPVPGDGHPFVDFVGVVVLLRIERPRKLPILAPCHGVQRHDLQCGARIHDAVHHQRRVFHLVLTVRILRVERMVGPFQLQIFDVGPIDLRQRAVAMPRVVARVAEPVLWLAIGAQKAVVGYFCGRRGSQEREEQHGANNHGGHPLSGSDLVSCTVVLEKQAQAAREQDLTPTSPCQE